MWKALILIGSLSFVAPALPQEDPAARSKAKDFTAMRKDLEIMKRVLEKEAFGRGSRSVYYVGEDSFFDSGMGVFGSRSSEGFYLPGEGALFLFSVSFPLAPSNLKSLTEGEGKKEPSLWDKVAAEVEGKPIYDKKRKGKPYKAEEVEKLKTKILTVLAQYGGNMSQLDNNNHLTIIVRGKTEYSSSAFSYELTAPEMVAIGEGQSSSMAIADAPPAPSVVAASGRKTTVLTIRVRRSDAVAAGKGDLTMEDFRKRALIGQY